MKKINDYMKTIDAVIKKGPFKPTWESLKGHVVPKWYQNAKFGIFIHWGVYSVPAFHDEWYPRFMYLEGHPAYEHHIKTYGPHKDFGYKDFIPMFTAPKFDANEWAELFAESGAKYVMPVAEHHDGFQLYDSELSEWTSVKMGPKKDIVGLLKEECEKRGMVFTASSHRIEHYWFMCGGKQFESDMPQEVPYGDLYWPSIVIPDPHLYATEGVFIPQDFMDDWLVRTCELVDKYRPLVLYFDWWIQIEGMKEYLQKFAAYYYNRAAEWGVEVAINYKFDAFMYKTAIRDVERGQLAYVSPDFWQACTAVAKNSWGYTQGNDYKKTNDIICDLIDVVSKNGTMLLNVGPHPDGHIPQEDAKILKEIGAWMKVNGEGIYDITYWRRFGEGPTQTPEGTFTDTLRDSYTTEDFRFTYKDGVLYVFALNWPDDGVVRIKALGASDKCAYRSMIKSVEVLGCTADVKTVRCDDYLTVIAPGHMTDLPVCIKVTLK